MEDQKLMQLIEQHQSFNTPRTKEDLILGLNQARRNGIIKDAISRKSLGIIYHVGPYDIVLNSAAMVKNLPKGLVKYIKSGGVDNPFYPYIEITEHTNS